MTIVSRPSNWMRRTRYSNWVQSLTEEIARLPRSSMEASGLTQLVANVRGLAKSRYVSTYLNNYEG